MPEEKVIQTSGIATCDPSAGVTTQESGVVGLDFASIKSIIKSVQESSGGFIGPQYGFQPTGGWDKWCAWASRDGVTARILRSISKNVMAFGFKCNNDKALKIMKKKARQIHLRNRLNSSHHDWNTYGRTFIEPVWVEEGDKKTDLLKIKVVNPSSITIYWDSPGDIESLRNLFKNTDYINVVENEIAKHPETGDNVVGFAQHVNVADVKPIFLSPEQLIFIPRYPDHENKQGFSLLRENYYIINAKKIMEEAQVAMAKAFTMPRMKHTIPMELWGRREEIMKAVRSGWEGGLDIFVPAGVDSKIQEFTGGGAAQYQALRHTQGQYIAAMGFADAFTESDSSNRSVGEIQLQFFERDIEPERAFFEEILTDRIIRPFMEIHGFTEEDDMPDFDWEDLTPEDRLSWAQVMSGVVDLMDYGQLKAFFEYINLPVTGEKYPDGLRPRTPAPQQPPSPQQPAALPPGQHPSGGQPSSSSPPTRGQSSRQGDDNRDLKTTAGIPRQVQKTRKSMRETMINEIDGWREEILALVGD